MLTFSAQLIDFAFNPYSILSLLGIVVNLLLIYLILAKGLQNSTTRWFVLFLSLLVLWGVSEFFGRLSQNPIAADFWGYIGAPGWIVVPVAFFNFALSYVGKEDWLASFGRRLLIFAPILIFLFLVWKTNYVTVHTGYHEVPWGWEPSPQSGPWFSYFIIWLEANFIAALALLGYHYHKAVDQTRKKQTLLLIFALLIPLIGGTVTDAVFPIIGISAPGTAILLTSALGVLATYAILRYNLFVINPATHFANIVKTVNEALLVVDLTGAVVFTNDAVSRVFGFKPENLHNKKLQTLFRKAEDLNIFESNFLSKVNKGEFVSGVELNLASSTGEEIPVSLSGSPLYDDAEHIVGYVLVASDMRELRKLVYNLVAERNKLSVTLSGITEGVFVLDKDGVISFFNEAAERIFEVKASEIIGKKADQVLNISDQDGPIHVDYFFPQEKLSKDMVTFSRNGVKIQTPAGKVNYANLIAANIVEGENINMGAIVTLHDVSKEKELEEMKLDFVSMAAHELRTPLTSIRGYLSVLQEEIGKELSPDQYSFLEKAFISSTQLAALVENLLSVSRIERGSLQIQSQITEWESIVEEAYNNFVPQARERQVTFTYIKPKEKLPLVLVDKFRIGEVISNLVGNALNYTPAGGKVEVSLEANAEEVITHVKDTGPGIPAGAIPKLFTKFFRVSGVLEQGSKGTGLGLYISKAIVDMHKGRIWVDSELGNGSIFSFSVPVSKEQKLPEKPFTQKGKRMFLRRGSGLEVAAESK